MSTAADGKTDILYHIKGLRFYFWFGLAGCFWKQCTLICHTFTISRKWEWLSYLQADRNGSLHKWTHACSGNMLQIPNCSSCFCFCKICYGYYVVVMAVFMQTSNKRLYFTINNIANLVVTTLMFQYWFTIKGNCRSYILQGKKGCTFKHWCENDLSDAKLSNTSNCLPLAYKSWFQKQFYGWLSSCKANETEENLCHCSDLMM